MKRKKTAKRVVKKVKKVDLSKPKVKEVMCQKCGTPMIVSENAIGGRCHICATTACPPPTRKKKPKGGSGKRGRPRKDPSEIKFTFQKNREKDKKQKKLAQNYKKKKKGKK